MDLLNPKRIDLKRLDLVVPGLCGPLPDLDALRPSSTLDKLSQRLSRASRQRVASRDYHQELAALLGLEAAAGMASAALNLLAHGRQASQVHCLHADPVYLQADMDRAVLRDGASLNISEHDAQALLAELNTHLQAEGVRLFAVDNSHWFMDLGRRSRISTSALHDVIGRNVNFFMPRGEDASELRRLLTEVQMLLHMSPVNRQREQAGLLPVNSLWLWGEGDIPPPRQSAWRRLYGNQPLIRGLALSQQLDHATVSDAATLLNSLAKQTGPSLVVLDELFNIACYGDVGAWQQQLEQFFVDWLEPVLEQVHTSNMTLNLYPCNGVRYCIRRRDRFRFLRRGTITNHITLHEQS